MLFISVQKTQSASFQDNPPFIRLQNDTEQLNGEKRWKMRWKANSIICFCVWKGLCCLALVGKRHSSTKNRHWTGKRHGVSTKNRHWVQVGRHEVQPKTGTGQENVIVQPKTGKWFTSPGSFFIVFHRVNSLFMVSFCSLDKRGLPRGWWGVWKGHGVWG